MEKNILRLLTFLFSSFLFGVLLIYAFYPTMYVDESLYVGAAIQFLKGDVFLSEYWFDKPIFMGLISVPGILFFGKNILGFSFSGIIASLFSFVYFKDIFGKNFSWVGFLLAAIFFTNPFHLSYLPSAMAEPFLLLALILCMKNLFQFGQTNELKFRNRMFIWFAIAIGFKQSPVMFIPMVFGVFLIKEKSIKYFTRQLVDFFNHTKYIWIVFIFYQATNQTKFAAITWFSKLTDQKIKYSFFEHLVFWSKEVFLTQRFSYLGVLFLFLFGVYTIQILKKIKDEKLPLLKFEKISFEDPRADLVIFIIPLLLHFIGISLSNVKHTDRYLFILNIQFLVVLFRFISIQKLNMKRIIAGFLLIGLFGNLWTMFDKREELDENIFKGKALLYADSIIPEGSIVHGRLKWHIYPYFKDFFLNS